jgi:hypothetical protein
MQRQPFSQQHCGHRYWYTSLPTSSRWVDTGDLSALNLKRGPISLPSAQFDYDFSAVSASQSGYS